MKSGLSSAEFQRIRDLSAPERLQIAVTEWQDGGDVWTLADGQSLLLLGDEDSPPLLVAWPHDEFALAWGEQTELGDVELVAIDGESFRETTLPELAEAEVTLRIFPTATDEGVDILAEELIQLLS